MISVKLLTGGRPGWIVDLSWKDESRTLQRGETPEIGMIRHIIPPGTVQDDRGETHWIRQVTNQGTRDLREGRDGETPPGTSGLTLLGRMRAALN